MCVSVFSCLRPWADPEEEDRQSGPTHPLGNSQLAIDILKNSCMGLAREAIGPVQLLLEGGPNDSL